MASRIVNEPGIYGGVYRQAGSRYDDGKGGADDPQINAAGKEASQDDGGRVEPDRTLGQQGGGPDGGAPADNYDTLTRPELERLAQDRGLDIGSARTKADIVEALRRAP